MWCAPLEFLQKLLVNKCKCVFSRSDGHETVPWYWNTLTSNVVKTIVDANREEDLLDFLGREDSGVVWHKGEEAMLYVKPP